MDSIPHSLLGSFLFLFLFSFWHVVQTLFSERVHGLQTFGVLAYYKILILPLTFKRQGNDYKLKIISGYCSIVCLPPVLQQKLKYLIDMYLFIYLFYLKVLGFLFILGFLKCHHNVQVVNLLKIKKKKKFIPLSSLHVLSIWKPIYPWKLILFISWSCSSFSFNLFPICNSIKWVIIFMLLLESPIVLFFHVKMECKFPWCIKSIGKKDRGSYGWPCKLAGLIE